MSRYRGVPPTTLYVRNVSTRCRYDDLKSFFQQYGKIIDITIPLDYYSGMPKGFCFVEYDDPRDAEEAQYRLDRKYFFGREIDVEFARGVRQTASDMRVRERRYMPEEGSRRRDDYSGRRVDDYERGYSRRSRSRSRSREDRRSPEYRRSSRRKQVVESSRRSHSRTRSRSRSHKDQRSYTKSKSRTVSRNRSPSPPQHNGRSVSRDSHDMSDSRGN